MFNRERHIGWCPVYKAGSTSWLHNMMRLAGISEKDLTHPPKQLSIWAREVYGEIGPGSVKLSNYLRQFVIRT